MAGVEHGAGSTPALASGAGASAESEALAELAIRRVLERYAIGIDTGDDDLLGSSFAADAVQLFGDGTRCSGRQEIIDHIRAVLTGIRSTHLVGNVEVTFEGATARARSWGTAHLIRRASSGSELLTRGLRYEDRLELRDGRWVIVERRHEPLWMTVQPLAESLEL